VPTQGLILDVRAPIEFNESRATATHHFKYLWKSTTSIALTDKPPVARGDNGSVFRSRSIRVL